MLKVLFWNLALEPFDADIIDGVPTHSATYIAGNGVPVTLTWTYLYGASLLDFGVIGKTLLIDDEPSLAALDTTLETFGLWEHRDDILRFTQTIQTFV